MKPNLWNDEFKEFVLAQEMHPDLSVTGKIHQVVRSELNPSWQKVSFKALMVHLLVGASLLSVCPQFGIGGFHGLEVVLMRFGHHVCTFICGAIFLGVSAMVIGLALQPEEMRVLRTLHWFPLLFLSLISLGIFHLLGANLFMSISLVWIVGALLGSFVGLQSGWNLQLRFRGLKPNAN
jgi:hypothetical protein